jgi:purine-binding chemotaxis protein CheW
MDGTAMSAKRIDWEAIHRRMAQAETAVAHTERRSREETAAVLKARAADLAREDHRDGAPAERLEVLAFSLGKENYGIETRFVEEVAPIGELTPLPGSPQFVLGVVNVRGQVLSVIDIRILLDLPQRGRGEQDRVIVLRHRGMEFGILGNAILGVVPVPVNELQAALQTLSGAGADFLRGITRERMAVLDGSRLLTDERIIVREEV